MMRGSILLLALLALVSLAGCRMCGNDQDCSYPATGGIWRRTVPNTGRVGSIFAPAGAKVGVSQKATLHASEPWANEKSPADSEQKDAPSKSLLDGLDLDVEDGPNEAELPPPMNDNT